MPPTPNASEPSNTNIRQLNNFATPKSGSRFVPVVPASSVKPLGQLPPRPDSNIHPRSKVNTMSAQGTQLRPATMLDAGPGAYPQSHGTSNVPNRVNFNQVQLPPAVVNSRRFVSSIPNTPQIRPQRSATTNVNNAYDQRSRQSSRIITNLPVNVTYPSIQALKNLHVGIGSRICSDASSSYAFTTTREL